MNEEIKALPSVKGILALIGGEVSSFTIRVAIYIVCIFITDSNETKHFMKFWTLRNQYSNYDGNIHNSEA